MALSKETLDQLTAEFKSPRNRGQSELSDSLINRQAPGPMRGLCVMGVDVRARV
ncbi:MAG: hypothetical protein HC938_15555 [Nitrospira sp.]|nr:hypothetical protein [Nitrospira sp.]